MWIFFLVTSNYMLTAKLECVTGWRYNMTDQADRASNLDPLNLSH